MTRVFVTVFVSEVLLTRAFPDGGGAFPDGGGVEDVVTFDGAFPDGGGVGELDGAFPDGGGFGGVALPSSSSSSSALPSSSSALPSSSSALPSSSPSSSSSSALLAAAEAFDEDFFAAFLSAETSDDDASNIAAPPKAGPRSSQSGALWEGFVADEAATGPPSTPTDTSASTDNNGFRISNAVVLMHDKRRSHEKKRMIETIVWESKNSCSCGRLLNFEKNLLSTLV